MSSSTPRRPQIQQHLPRKHLTGDQVMVMEQNLVQRDNNWNPTLRMAQMRGEYDRLVKDLGMSPRGGSMQLPHHAQYDMPGANPKYGTGMPRVPSDRPWGKGGPKSGAKTARERRFKESGADTIGSGVGGAIGQTALDDAATWNRAQMRINEMAVAGHITSKQAEQLKRLQKMQENLLREAQAEIEAALSPHAPVAPEAEAEPEGGSPVKMVAAAQQLLGWLDNPEVEEGATPGEGDEAEPLPTAEGASKPETPLAEPKPATPGAASEAAGLETVGSEAEGYTVARPRSAGIPRKLAGLLAKNMKRVIDVFREWDKDQNGQVTKKEFTKGLASLKMSVDAADIDALFMHFDPDGSGSIDFKELQAVLRKAAPEKKATLKSADGGKSKMGDKSVAERAKEAAEAVLRPEDLMSSQKGIDRVEEALRSGRLPSLSPDEGEDGGDMHGGASKKSGGESAVWSAIEARLLPHGLAAAPAWQQEMLQKVQWKVECKNTAQRKQKELAHAKLSSTSGVPTWRPAKGGAAKMRPGLLSRELAQAQARELAQQEVHEEEQRMLAEAKAAGTSVSAFAKEKMHDAGVQLVAEKMEDMDVTPAHLRFLREAEAEVELETTARVNKLAFYEQAMQQQQLERQTLQSEMQATQLGIGKVERGAQQGRADAAAGVTVRKRERLARDVCAVSLKANQMEALTHTLMHVIGSLRKGRKRHLEAASGMHDKESQMDADSSFLMSSATMALEERERIRSKAERVKYESKVQRQVQLREAAALQVTLRQLDDDHDMLEDKLEGHHERQKQQEYSKLRGGRDGGESRALKFGFLRSQAGGWAGEFERITEMTGVSFGVEAEGEGEAGGEDHPVASAGYAGQQDAVEKVVAIYSEKEARNASLFKFVTEDVTRQKEGLMSDIAKLRAEEEQLLEALRLVQAQAAVVSAPSSPTPKGGEGEGEGEGEEGGPPLPPPSPAGRLAQEVTAWHSSLEASLSIFDTLGREMGIPFPEHMQGKGCSLTTYPEFLSLLEQQMHDTFDSALHLATHPAPPQAAEEGAPAAADPRETLELLKSWTQPRQLFKGEAVLLKPRGDEPVVVLDA
jgi:hypothetical protein